MRGYQTSIEKEKATCQVSVWCMAYNHEKYIRDTLNGFVSQKTDFGFEVIIHDDASTDNTADIIREYEQKFPDIIKPIYQVKNQYSQNVSIEKDFFIPRTHGKYIALCEGDDYWTDPLKLQKQYEFLEKNPDYVAIAGNVILIEDDGTVMTKNSPLYLPFYEAYTNMGEHDLTLEEVARCWMAGQTCTRMFRNFWMDLSEYILDVYFSARSVNGDQKLSLLLYCMGRVRCSSEVYGRHRKSLVNDSYTARSQGRNLCARRAEAFIELEKIASCFGIFPDYTAVRAGNIKTALRYCLQRHTKEDFKIFIGLCLHMPSKIKMVCYGLKKIRKCRENEICRKV